jgi:hypothetical protein
VVEGETLILAIYCPEHLADYQKYVEQLKFANVVKE